MTMSSQMLLESKDAMWHDRILATISLVFGRHAEFRHDKLTASGRDGVVRVPMSFPRCRMTAIHPAVASAASLCTGDSSHRRRIDSVLVRPERFRSRRFVRRLRTSEGACNITVSVPMPFSR